MTMENEKHRLLVQNFLDLESDVRSILSLPQLPQANEEDNNNNNNGGRLSWTTSTSSCQSSLKIRQRIVFLKNLIAAEMASHNNIPHPEHKRLSDLANSLQSVESALINPTETMPVMATHFPVEFISDHKHQQHCYCVKDDRRSIGSWTEDHNDQMCDRDTTEEFGSSTVEEVLDNGGDMSMNGFEVYENPEYQYASLEDDGEVLQEGDQQEEESTLIDDHVIQEEAISGGGGGSSSGSVRIDGVKDVTKEAIVGGGSKLTDGVKDDGEVSQEAASCGEGTGKVTGKDSAGESGRQKLNCNSHRDSDKIRENQRCNGHRDCYKPCTYERCICRRNSNMRDSEYCRYWPALTRRLLVVALMVVGLVVVCLAEWRRFNEIVGDGRRHGSSSSVSVLPNLIPT